MIHRRAFAVLALFAPMPPRVPATEPTHAQPILPKQMLTIMGEDGTKHVFHVEIATTEKEQVTGLMFRHSAPTDGGMLFVWKRPEISETWMQNMLVPLDTVFIKEDGTIARIIDGTVPESPRILSSDVPAKATPELQGSITAKLGIVADDKVLSPLFNDMP